jgi:hypothetical protein
MAAPREPAASLLHEGEQPRRQLAGRVLLGYAHMHCVEDVWSEHAHTTD